MVTTPKVPLPPRIPQKRSSFSSALAVSNRPSAVTTSDEIRLSQARPYLPLSQPRPPPRVSPAIPVIETTPRVVASPNPCVSRSNSPSVRLRGLPHRIEQLREFDLGLQRDCNSGGAGCGRKCSDS